MAAIYLHIPFCKRLCGYCDFFKSVKLDSLEATLAAMEREIVEERGFLGEGEIDIETIYFGGGTPSLLSAEQIGRLLDVIAENYNLERLHEVTIEVNPDDITEEYLRALRSRGVNRLSIGIQSFDDDLLKFMNRRHDSAQAEAAVRMAQSVGFDNITIDLIFGVDGFGTNTLLQSIEKTLSLEVQHISAYHLTIESGTPFARRVAKGEMQTASEQKSQEEYNLLEQELTTAGYEHYEVSNYAKPGFRSAHNASYWRGVHYLGIGAGAHSFNGHSRRWAINSIEGYLKGGQGRYQSEELSLEDRYNEFIMTSLRCSEGISLEMLKSNFPSYLEAFALTNANRWLLEGKLANIDGQLYIPTQHFLISDTIIESLFYCKP